MADYRRIPQVLRYHLERYAQPEFLDKLIAEHMNGNLAFSPSDSHIDFGFWTRTPELATEIKSPANWVNGIEEIWLEHDDQFNLVPNHVPL